MNNQEIASLLFEMADILEMKDIAWKPRAYRQAARAIDALPEDIAIIYKKGGIKLLKEIPGIGEHIANKIIEFLETGKIKAHGQLKKQVPSSTHMLLKIIGMGPKKVKKLNKILNIKTVKQLEKAAKAHKIAKIPGFGSKSEQDILDGIILMKQSRGRIPLKTAEKEAAKLIKKLKPLKETLKISTAGSLKRKKPTIGDIDLLVCSKKPEKIIEVFTKIKAIQKVLAKGSTKASIVLKSGIQVDLRVLPPESWGSGLLYFIGSKNYNIELRKIAIKKGYKLNEYGLFDKQTGKRIAGKTEREVLKKIHVPYLTPGQRER